MCILGIKIQVFCLCEKHFAEGTISLALVSVLMRLHCFRLGLHKVKSSLILSL